MNFIANESAQKLRGGYYTPLDLATFLARWVKEISPTRLLEPSCGDGVFFEALAKTKALQKMAMTMGFELNEAEAAKAQRRASGVGLKATVKAEDFLQWASDRLKRDACDFDAVLGNPPFVRYQYLPEPFQFRAEAIFRQLSLPFTKHTNAWVPFVIASMALLRPGGRLALVGGRPC